MRRLSRTLLLSAVLVTAALPLRAQVASQADKRTLLRLENGWTAALVKRDKSYFTQTLASGFVYTEDDKLYTRDEVLRDIVTPSDTVTSANNELMVVHLFGTTAAVTGILVVNGRANGAPYTHRYRFTDTWQKQKDGAWRIIAAQDYLITGKR